MFYLLAYILLGLLLCALVAVIGRIRGKTDFTPISFVFGGGESFTFILSLLIWPVWIIIQIVEWSHPPDPISTPTPPPAPITPGTPGIAHTDLKPGGKIRIENRLIDAVSTTGHIPSGTEIQVLTQTPTGVRVAPRNP